MITWPHITTWPHIVVVYFVHTQSVNMVVLVQRLWERIFQLKNLDFSELVVCTKIFEQEMMSFCHIVYWDILSRYKSFFQPACLA